MDGQLPDCLRDRRKTIGPVLAVTGDQPNIPAIEPGQQAITIEFNFTDPVTSVGRIFDQGTELWDLIGGWPPLYRARRGWAPGGATGFRYRHLGRSFMLQHRRADAFSRRLVTLFDQKP